MRCRECGATTDELNESQPVCPGCGFSPGGSIEAYTEDEVVSAEMPADLQMALDDAEALLLATGQVMFNSPEGLRLFQLPTDRLM